MEGRTPLDQRPSGPVREQARRKADPSLVVLDTQKRARRGRVIASLPYFDEHATVIAARVDDV
ncbi:hypothetical protein ACFU3E_21440 [Streptomyces sp. NPDC057424]|uniref:hypothetical protein n=1 Tax=Streptomyces sp. NPDC057424 TaxID=3346127 RepID=UPI003694D55C